MRKLRKQRQKPLTEPFKETIRKILAHVASWPWLCGILRIASHKGIMPGAVWRRLPVEGRFSVTLPDKAAFFYSSVPNDTIGRALYWQGWRGWETESLLTFYAFAKDARCVLDIGANTGIFTLLACTANPQLQVTCFEPVPRIFERLQTNLAINGWSHRCQLHRVAVSDRPGEAEFHVPYSDVPTSGSLHREGFRGIDGELIRVPIATVDSTVTGQTEIDLVKIDVEGFEHKVLDGMRRTLTLSQPTIFFECNPDGPFKEVEAILRTFSYELFHLQARGAVNVETIVPDQTGRYRNFVATKQAMP